MYVIGIDPGNKGGLAVLDYDDKGNINIEHLIPFNEKDYIDIAREYSSARGKVCVLESVHAMPKQGVTSMFNFGKSYGWLRGVMDMSGIPIIDVTPQSWKRTYGLLHKDKSESILMAKFLCDNINLFPTKRCKKESDGMAEAYLIALHDILRVYSLNYQSHPLEDKIERLSCKL